MVLHCSTVTSIKSVPRRRKRVAQGLFILVNIDKCRHAVMYDATIGSSCSNLACTSLHMRDRLCRRLARRLYFFLSCVMCGIDRLAEWISITRGQSALAHTPWYTSTCANHTLDCVYSTCKRQRATRMSLATLRFYTRRMEAKLNGWTC